MQKLILAALIFASLGSHAFGTVLHTFDIVSDESRLGLIPSGPTFELDESRASTGVLPAVGTPFILTGDTDTWRLDRVFTVFDGQTRLRFLNVADESRKLSILLENPAQPANAPLAPLFPAGPGTIELVNVHRGKTPFSATIDATSIPEPSAFGFSLAALVIVSFARFFFSRCDDSA